LSSFWFCFLFSIIVDDFLYQLEFVREQEYYAKRKSYDAHKKRKYEESRKRSHEGDESSKRSKGGEESSSNIGAPKTLTSSVPMDIPSSSPALQKTDIQAILKGPSTIPRAPTMLESRFPKWCLRGVRFDLDLVPIDKDAMLKNLDAVKQDIERMHNWQKLVDEL